MGRSPTPEEPIGFGPLLRQYRIAAGLTQETLAERTGLGVRSIQHLEGGAHLPHRETVGRLIKGLGITGDDRTHFERSAQPSPRQREASSRSADEAHDDQPVPRDNLPGQLTSFVGRERELAEVGRLLGSTRLLTITGVGGTGKTRLALQFATGVLDAYADGAWLVDLAPLVDPALVPQTVASAIGVVEQTGEPIQTTLRRVLRDRQLLLILDNCEHLIDACAQLTDALLRGCPRLQILATSREALGIAGEVAWSLPSLPVPTADWLTAHPDSSVVALNDFAALRLFADRAHAAHPAFQVTKQNVAAVVQICRRVDGIPLAIELAAARVKVFSVERIAGRLDDIFRLLTGGSRTALPRQQTLKATIDWSHHLLDEPERLLFRRLSVFVGGCSYEAIEEVCAGDGIDVVDVADLLARLVDRSLVVVEPEEHERYRLLETLRQYGRDRLVESGEAEVVRNRHRDWFIAMAERAEPELFGSRQLAWLDRLELEIGNLRAALEWALERGPAELGLRLAGALGRFWWTRDYQSDGRDWLERALAAPGAETRTAARAKSLDRLALNAGLDDLATVRRSYEESLAICHEIGDRRGVAWAVRQLGLLALEHGENVRAEELSIEALALAREAEDQWVIAQALESLGVIAWRRGDHSSSRRLLGESLQLFRETEDWRAIGMSLSASGQFAAEEGDHAVARADLAEALAILRTFRSKEPIARALCDLGLLTQLEGDPEQATALVEEGLALARATGVTWTIIYALTARGLVARSQANIPLTQNFAREALMIVRESRLDSASGPFALGLPGILSIERGDYRQGIRILGAAALQPRRGWMMIGARRVRDEAVSLARTSVGDNVFAATWAEGQAMTLEQAVAYALEEAIV